MAEELDQAASEAEAAKTFEDVLAQVIAERDAGEEPEAEGDQGSQEMSSIGSAAEGEGDRGSQEMSSIGSEGDAGEKVDAPEEPIDDISWLPNDAAAAQTEGAQSDAAATQPNATAQTAIAPHNPLAALRHRREESKLPGALDLDDSAAAAFEALERQRAAKRRKKFLRIGIAALVVAAAAGIFWFTQLRQPAAPEEEFIPETAYVYRGDLQSTVSASGSLKPYSSVVVTPEVEGTVESISITADQAVAVGDVLFTIKNDELDRAVQQAGQTVRAAQNDVANANNALSNARWQLDAARAAFAANPEMTYDEGALNAEIEAARQQVDAANMALENANIAYNDAVDIANKRTVRAPATGTIIAMDLQVGQAVGPSSQGLMQIADLSQMRVNVQVNEIDISSIAEGQRAVATFSAVDGVQLEGKVARIASVATGMENDADMYDGGGIANFAVEILFPQPDPALKPGMTATIQIYTLDVPDVLIVDQMAVYELGDGQWYADVVVDPETYETETVQVQVGEQNQSEIAITSGLNEGDELLVSGGGSFGGDDYDGDGAMYATDGAAIAEG